MSSQAFLIRDPGPESPPSLQRRTLPRYGLNSPPPRSDPPPTPGHIGDKYGRRWSFTFAILQQALGTFLIGVLPTYNIGRYQAGVAAPVLLSLIRVIQARRARLACVGAFVCRA